MPLSCLGAKGVKEDNMTWSRIIIGDGDSLYDAYRQQYATLIHHNPDQETNDQTKAVHYLHAQGMRRIAIVGATGKREDHTIGNLSLLIEYMRLGMEVRTYTDYGVFVPCRGTHTFPSRPGQHVSIFNFTARELRAQGLAYPLYDFPTWWQGTLNSCTGPHSLSRTRANISCSSHIETQSACFYNQRIAQIKQIPVTVDVPIRRT